MPSQPLVTFPFFLSWGRSSLIRLIGIVKPMPMLLPTLQKRAVLIPTTSPRILIKGPAEFPGLMEASVWIKLSDGPAPICLPLAPTIPEVAVCSRPKGLPIATVNDETRSQTLLAEGTLRERATEKPLPEFTMRILLPERTRRYSSFAVHPSRRNIDHRRG